jgi:hypothetical protein
VLCLLRAERRAKAVCWGAPVRSTGLLATHREHGGLRTQGLEGLDPGADVEVDLGFGRVVASETEPPKTTVKSGIAWLNGVAERQCDRTLSRLTGLKLSTSEELQVVSPPLVSQPCQFLASQPGSPCAEPGKKNGRCVYSRTM